MLILSQDDLKSLLSMREVISAVEEVFKALSRGDAIAPERLHLQVPNQGVLLEMPAYAKLFDRSALGTKLVSVFENNITRGLDVVQSSYLLLDSETGAPLALMDGRFITAIRTAATSALATKLMAVRSPKRLAIFGAGVQGRFHLAAMMEVATINTVLISSRNPERARVLAADAVSLHGLKADVVSAEEAAARSDLICTCTSSTVPLFNGSIVSRGTHINAVGAYTPRTRELDSETVRRAYVVIDSESAAGREAGEVLIPLAEGGIDASHIKGTLADVITGKVPGRTSPDDITLFKSCGLAIEDLVTADLAFRKAGETGVGVSVDI